MTRRSYPILLSLFTAILALCTTLILSAAPDTPESSRMDPVMDFRIQMLGSGLMASDDAKLPPDFDTQLLTRQSKTNNPASRPSLLGFYKNVYPGIDLASFGNDTTLEYVFRVAPGADPALIRVSVDGAPCTIRNPAGELEFKLRSTSVRQSYPTVAVGNGDQRSYAKASYLLLKNGSAAIDTSAIRGKQEQTLNGSTLNLVPAGDRPYGPDYDFYLSKHEISNQQFVRFLNDAQKRPGSSRSANMFFDASGNVWFNPDMADPATRLFSIGNSRITYKPDLPVGKRFNVETTDNAPSPFSNHPVCGVSWYGAIKYCNWLTIASGRGPDSRCYSEGTNAAAWHPSTARNWEENEFTDEERKLWLSQSGFRLPMAPVDGHLFTTNLFSEFLKAASWRGATCSKYGNGRDQVSKTDVAGRIEPEETTSTTPVGFFNGINTIAGQPTAPNENAFGLYDLSGNAAEWTADPVPGAHGALFALAGGSAWDAPLPEITRPRVTAPSDSSSSSGFRCLTTFNDEPPMYIHVVFNVYTELPPGNTGIYSDMSKLDDIYRTKALTLGSSLDTTSAPTQELPKVVAKQAPTSAPKTAADKPDSPANEDGVLVATVRPQKDLIVGTIYKTSPSSILPPTPGGSGSSWSGGGGGGGEEETRPQAPETVQSRFSDSGTAPVVTGKPTPFTLGLRSVNPNEGVRINVIPPDIRSNASSRTPFNLLHMSKTQISLSAPPSASGNQFVHWLKDSTVYSAQPATSFELTTNTTFTAVYSPLHIVSINSFNPELGVRVTANPADYLGTTSGRSTFFLQYGKGTNVNLTAELSSAGKYFSYWNVDGIQTTHNRTLNLTVDRNKTATAVYTHLYALNLRSIPIDSIEMTTSGDYFGVNQGNTPLTQQFGPGTNAIATAPLTHGSFLFVHWLRDGRIVSTNRAITSLMYSDITLTAFYTPLRFWIISSINPDSGAAIDVEPPDEDGLTDGNTVFVRNFGVGTNATIRAAETASGNYFVHWLKNAEFLTTNHVYTARVDWNAGFTAVYTPLYTYKIKSYNPNTTVPITASTPDYYQRTDANTEFTRRYGHGTNITFTAPPTMSDNYFAYWALNGTPVVTSLYYTSTAVADTELAAVYTPIRTVSVRSSTPDNDVPIAVSRNDHFGNPGAGTPFNLRYGIGTNVTLTAPLTSAGNYFVYWTVDGVLTTTNLSLALNVNRDMTVKAVYQPLYFVNVISLPDPGVPVESSPDYFQYAGQNTPYTRQFGPGTNVTVTAPRSAGGLYFAYWTLNGDPFTTNLNASITVQSNATFAAVYTPLHALNVASLNPDSGAAITLQPADYWGAADAATAFTRRYGTGTNVTLTAPATVGDNYFVHWRKNGTPVSTNLDIDVVMLADTTLTAVYTPLHTFSIRSANPNNNVTIVPDVPDHFNRLEGLTTFTRRYGTGTNITFSTPPIVSENYFAYWLVDGAIASTSINLRVTAAADTTIVAMYTPIKSVTLNSANPDSGVPIIPSRHDHFSRIDGVTSFERRYGIGTNLTYTAPISAGENYFSRWWRNNAIVTTSLVINIVVDDDMTLLAEYMPLYKVDIRSTPLSGVNIAASPDYFSRLDAATPFQRLYGDGTNVTLTAPLVADRHLFVHWMQDGIVISTNLSTTIRVSADTTIQAIYTPLRELAVSSSRPDAGVPITVTPPEYTGQASGPTPFQRLYGSGTNVTLVAQPTAGNNYFAFWQKDGVLETTNLFVTVTMNADTRMKAVYTPVYTFKIQSIDPASGIPVTTAPIDFFQYGSGTTAFERRYGAGTNVSFTAPATAGLNYFAYWAVNGTPVATSLTVVVLADADATITAAYTPVHTVTVRSRDPDSGVPVTVPRPDHFSAADGTTEFLRRFGSGTNATFIAPVSAGGNYFSRWWVDGAISTTGRSVTVRVTTDTTLEAEYMPLYKITLSSTPQSGVDLQITPDYFSQPGAQSPFVRLYGAGTNITVTAPLIADNHLFVHWLKDGTIYTTNLFASLTVSRDTALQAVYTPLRALTVQSATPDSGVAITATPPEYSGAADGATPFRRLYGSGTNVTLTAPPTAAGNYFAYWQKNGAFETTNLYVSLTLNADTLLRAVYTPVYTFSFQSTTPNSGVTIVPSLLDFFQNGDGTTAFQRRYGAGTNVTLTAPPTAAGNYFAYWSVNGTVIDTNNVVTLPASNNLTIVAAYTPLFNVTFRSLDPNSGVTLDTLPADYFSRPGAATEFVRQYGAGTNLEVTAPQSAAGGRYFTRWLQDGAIVTTSRTWSFSIAADTILTAEYMPLINLDVESSPPANVPIAITPDYFSTGDGPTPFARKYGAGTNVTATAPLIATDHLFVHWILNGAILTTNQIASFPITANSTLQAYYTPLRTLTVQSATPDSGANITVTPPQYDGSASDVTTFSRRYGSGTNVTLTAAPTTAGNLFVYWLRNGTLESTSNTVSIVLQADTTMTAVYTPVRTITIQSSNPDADVQILTTTNDYDDLAGGLTTFTRRYGVGTNIAFTAPQSAGGNFFAYWAIADAPSTTNLTINLNVAADTRLTAAYTPLYRLSLNSENPPAGVPVTISPPDYFRLGSAGTHFERLYGAGTNVTLSVPNIISGNYFAHWIINGAIASTSRVTTITMNADTTVTAIYAPIRILTINALPVNGLPVQVSRDFYGQTDGNTILLRRYLDGTNALVTAPATFGGYYFAHWLENGVEFTTNRTANVFMDANKTLTASYAKLVTLDVDSSPQDINMQATPDHFGLAGARTHFVRQYGAGTNVNVTAPAFDGILMFIHWQKDGRFFTTSHTANVTMETNTVLKAIYLRGFTINVRSIRESGAFISVNPADPNGDGDGFTEFARIYGAGTNVTFTAAPTLGTNDFVQWLRNGIYVTTNRAATIRVNGDMTLTAVYWVGPLEASLRFDPDRIRYDDPGSTLFTTVSGGVGPYTLEYFFILTYHQWDPQWQPSSIQDYAYSYDWNFSIKYKLKVTDSRGTIAWSNEAKLTVVDDVPDHPRDTQSGL